VKYLYHKIYKALLKEIKDDTYKCKHIPCPWIGRQFYTREYSFNAISLKISKYVFAAKKELILKSIWTLKGPHITTILS
jgi:hypothetical protein